MKENILYLKLRQVSFVKKIFIGTCSVISVFFSTRGILFSGTPETFYPLLTKRQSGLTHARKSGRQILLACKTRMAVSIVFFLFIMGQSVMMECQTPLITTRFSNPSYQCSGQYCVNVEFISDVQDARIFGMNVRFFYPGNLLELIGFSDFRGGYGPIAPNPPEVITSGPAGPAFFNFDGPASFVNGAIQLLDTNIVLRLDTAVWTKLFQICFDVVDPNANEESFCSSLVWDLEQDPANGGFLQGDDGVVITIVDPDPFIGSAPADVNVVQFNWMYTGDGSAPYGEPIQSNCIPLFFDAAINGSTSNLCYYTNRTFQPAADSIPVADYHWTFGSGAIPLTATGYGPHVVYYTTTGAKTVKLVILPNQQEAPCPDSSSISFNVTACPANITGSVKSVSGTGIGSVTINLYADGDFNGLPDNTVVVKSGNTVSNGNYNLLAITPGNYVIVQSQPLGWLSFDDRDINPDGDLVTNIDSLDNIIPCTLTPSKLDIGNNFIERPSPGSISGNVFIDDDHNGIPGASEGLSDVTVGVYHDDNSDGQPDSPVPVITHITDSLGFYFFPDVSTGNYVIIETQLHGYTSVEDLDASNDLDIVLNSNMHDDIIPVTITNGEHDDQNYFIDAEEDILLVKNLYDAGPGSMRHTIENAMEGDTISFDSSLAGLVINVTSNRIVISKATEIISTLSPPLTISSLIPGLFRVLNNVSAKFSMVDIISGLTITGNLGAAFENLGNLDLQDVHVFRNPALPAGQYLIRNTPNSTLILSGNCFFEMY